MAGGKELQVALIGTGMMGRMHSLAYATLPSFFPDLPPVRRRVVVDVTEDLARRGAHQFGYDEWAVGLEGGDRAPRHRHRRYRHAQRFASRRSPSSP